MKTLAQYTTYRNPVRHYASYYDIEGIATLLPGGYLFQPDGSPEPQLVAYKDSDLVLYGRCDLADAQQAALDGTLVQPVLGR